MESSEKNEWRTGSVSHAGGASGATGGAPEGAPGPDAAWTAGNVWTSEEALAMDGWLVRERGCTLPQLMAVAGARVVDAARALCRERGLTRVVLLVGPGNNGGDSLVAERLLRAEIETLAWQPLPRAPAAEELSAAACAVAGTATASALPAPVTTEPPRLDARTLVVDGLFGVGLARPLSGVAREAVSLVNASPATVLAIDIPSGLCATTGEILGAAIRAHATVTFVGPKRGFFVGAGPALTGSWRAVDLGFPPEEAHAWLARRRTC